MEKGRGRHTERSMCERETVQRVSAVENTIHTVYEHNARSAI